MSIESEEELAPAVRSILAAARERGAEGGQRVSVAARSLPEAFARAEADGRVPVIAEIKPTSPTTDGERHEDPVALAREMVAGGAAALSVLTEPEHFGGSTDALAAVRAAVDVPVLRKDFLLTEAQLDAVPADLVLLIARFLGDDLDAMVRAARERGFEPLVEVHTAAELERALAAGAEVVGVNNRDLARLAVDLGTFERVTADVFGTENGDTRTEEVSAAGDTPADGSSAAGDTPADGSSAAGDTPADGSSAAGDTTLIAESGIGTREDVARMRRAGADGLLIGSAIMDGDVRANTERLTTGDTDTT